MNPKDKSLGMDQPIARRNFLQGAAIGTAAAVAGLTSAEAAQQDEPQNAPEYYPPTRLGMRGSHPGSFEAAHELRDGNFWNSAHGLTDTHESYDLVVVGGGISGLSAAYFYRAKNPGAKILILENHDDFGGHAKRNEFHLGGRMEIINGGTLEIDSPTPYRAIAAGLLKTLGVDPVALTKECNDPKLYESMGLNTGVFFDRETFGVDKLVNTGTRERRLSAGHGQTVSCEDSVLGKSAPRHLAHRGRHGRLLSRPHLRSEEGQALAAVLSRLSAPRREGRSGCDRRSMRGAPMGSGAAGSMRCRRWIAGASAFRDSRD